MTNQNGIQTGKLKANDLLAFKSLYTYSSALCHSLYNEHYNWWIKFGPEDETNYHPVNLKGREFRCFWDSVEAEMQRQVRILQEVFFVGVNFLGPELFDVVNQKMTMT